MTNDPVPEEAGTGDHVEDYMRIISVLTALLVTVALYLMVMERDRVLSFAGRPAPPRATQPPAAADQPAPEDPALRPVSVVALHSAARPVDDVVTVRGRTEAARQVEIRAETSGRVISAPLRKGAFVTEGQPLCQIDPGTRAASLAEAEARLLQARASLPEAEARLTEARAVLAEAEINDNAAARLQEQGFASQSRAAATAAAVSSARAGVESARAAQDGARAGISAAQAAVAAAQKEIERLTIAAPFAGVLETDSAELGTLLQPGSLCAEVLQLDPIKLVGFLPETEVDKIAPGTDAAARLATGAEVAGRVSFLGRSADPATRTFRVEVEIANPDLTIRDGQTVEMALSSGDIQAHLLPLSALTLDDSGQLGVRLVAAGNTALFVPVAVLRDTVGGIWVTGLPDNADVIVIGQEFVIDGVPVRPVFDGVTQ
ncbi:efflux RND transporter periplasmic adaptor subunit [Actibacterium sp. D379-3]